MDGHTFLTQEQLQPFGAVAVHFKTGKRYRVIGTAIDAANSNKTDTPCMVYADEVTGALFTRPKSEFYEPVNHNGETLPRFSSPETGGYGIAPDMEAAKAGGMIDGLYFSFEAAKRNGLKGDGFVLCKLKPGQPSTPKCRWSEKHGVWIDL